MALLKLIGYLVPSGSIVRAARQFGMAKYRFARVATDLSHALFSDGRFKAWMLDSPQIWGVTVLYEQRR